VSGDVQLNDGNTSRCLADDAADTPRNADVFKTLDGNRQKSHIDAVIALR
jgi:hypothetical protein